MYKFISDMQRKGGMFARWILSALKILNLVYQGRDSVQGVPWLEIRGIERTVSMKRESQGIRTAVTSGDSSLLDRT